MITNKFTNAKQAKEITRLNAEVRRLQGEVKDLQRIVFFCDQTNVDRIEKDLQNMAGENAHLLARLAEVDPDNMCPLMVELKALSATGRMVRIMQANGYRQAAEDMRVYARKLLDPQPYDLLMNLAGQMDRHANDYAAS